MQYNGFLFVSQVVASILLYVEVERREELERRITALEQAQRIHNM